MLPGLLPLMRTSRSGCGVVKRVGAAPRAQDCRWLSMWSRWKAGWPSSVLRAATEPTLICVEERSGGLRLCRACTNARRGHGRATAASVKSRDSGLVPVCTWRQIYCFSPSRIRHQSNIGLVCAIIPTNHQPSLTLTWRSGCESKQPCEPPWLSHSKVSG